MVELIRRCLEWWREVKRERERVEMLRKLWESGGGIR